MELGLARPRHSNPDRCGNVDCARYPNRFAAALAGRALSRILPVDREGRRRNYGSRKHYDHASPVYRAFCRTLVTQMAERYGNHDAVIGWQIDNEWGESDSTRSLSECSLAAFRTWLEARYHSIDHLNDAWGGVFWSQEYRTWDEIQLPNLTMNEPNPSHVLDFYRFSVTRSSTFRTNKSRSFAGIHPAVS